MTASTCCCLLACLVAENYRITENWAAYIDPTTGEGVGIYTPVAQTITCYRVGKVGCSSTAVGWASQHMLVVTNFLAANILPNQLSSAGVSETN